MGFLSSWLTMAAPYVQKAAFYLTDTIAEGLTAKEKKKFIKTRRYLRFIKNHYPRRKK